MITYLLEPFKIFPLLFYQSCFLRSKTLDIPHNLSNQLVLRVLIVKLQQSSEIYIFCLDLCNTNAVKKIRSLITEMCNINL